LVLAKDKVTHCPQPAVILQQMVHNFSMVGCPSWCQLIINFWTQSPRW